MAFYDKEKIDTDRVQAGASKRAPNGDLIDKIPAMMGIITSIIETRRNKGDLLPVLKNLGGMYSATLDNDEFIETQRFANDLFDRGATATNIYEVGKKYAQSLNGVGYGGVKSVNNMISMFASTSGDGSTLFNARKMKFN